MSQSSRLENVAFSQDVYNSIIQNNVKVPLKSLHKICGCWPFANISRTGLDSSCTAQLWDEPCPLGLRQVASLTGMSDG